MCCGVVRLCGAERARFCADASCHADATLATAGSPRRWSPVRRDACRKRSADSAAPSGPSNTTELPTINVSAPRSPPQAQPQRHPTPSRAGANTCACAAVALPDRRSQRGWGNARRAANGEPDGHFRREPQLSPGGRTCRDPRSGARSCASFSIQAPARPINTTCAATISTTAPTWRPSGTTCRSTCPPTRMARATPTSTFLFPKRSADWRSARGRIGRTSETSTTPAR